MDLHLSQSCGSGIVRFHELGAFLKIPPIQLGKRRLHNFRISFVVTVSRLSTFCFLPSARGKLGLYLFNGWQTAF